MEYKYTEIKEILTTMIIMLENPEEFLISRSNRLIQEFYTAHIETGLRDEIADEIFKTMQEYNIKLVINYDVGVEEGDEGYDEYIDAYLGYEDFITKRVILNNKQISNIKELEEQSYLFRKNREKSLGRVNSIDVAMIKGDDEDLSMFQVLSY